MGSVWVAIRRNRCIIGTTQHFTEITVFRTAIAAALLASLPASAASPVVADAQGVVLGFFMGPREVADDFQTVVSSRGYTVRYDRITGLMGNGAPHAWNHNEQAVIGALYYLTSDCSGDPYLPVADAFTGGVVLKRATAGDFFFVPKNPETATQPSGSRRLESGVCQSGNTTTGRLVPVLPNNPSETGVQNRDAVPPFKIEVAEIDENTFRLLADGFEDPQVT